MGLFSSKPFQTFLNDILKKYDVIQLVAVVKSLLKITVSLKSQLIKKSEKYSGEDFDIID